MSKPREIIAISSGSYSDYRVLCVVEDEATAKRWVAALKCEPEGWHTDASIEHLTYIPSNTPPKMVTRWWMHVELWDNGKTETRSGSRTFLPVGYNGIPPRRPKIRYIRAPCYNNKGGLLEVEGSTEASVRRAAEDRIRLWKAGEWAGPKHQEIIEQVKD